MTYFIAANIAVENTRALAESALSTAPKRPHDRPYPRPGLGLRARLGAALRSAAARELHLADHVDRNQGRSSNAA
jgi:hypothetical protein